MSGFVVAGFVFAVLWWVYGRMWSNNAASPVGGKAQPFSHHNPFAFWRRMHRKDHYELVERHEV